MRRIAARILGVLAFTLTGAAIAQDYSYYVYVDRDVNAATGCSAAYPGGSITGAELRITANVTGTMVDSVSTATCAGGSFGSENAAGGPHPVGLNNGTGGADVIEFSVSRSMFGSASVVRVELASENGIAASSDLLRLTGSGGPIFLALSHVAIPMLGGFGLLLLISALLFIASRRLRVGMASAGAMLVAGAVWAAGFATDGAVGDWTGMSPLATDPSGDASGPDIGADVVALFGAEENGHVFFRVDAVDVENQAPVAQSQAPIYLEDAPTQTIVLTASDADGDPLTLTIQTPPTRGTLGPITPIDATSASVTYTPIADEFGADSFTFIANDGIVNSAPATVSITLTPVNDVPSFTAGPTITIVKDIGAQTIDPWATGISAGPANESAQTLSFTITANDNPTMFAVAPVVSPTGALSFTTAPDANGTANLTLRLQDSGGTANGGVDTAATQNFVIMLTPVNDAPSFVKGADQTVLEDAGPQTVDPWASAISAGPPDESGQTLTFNVTGNTNPGLFNAGPAVSPTGALTYTPAPDANGSATLTLTLQDNGGTASGGIDTSAPQTFVINVTPVNDAPVNTVPVGPLLTGVGTPLSFTGPNSIAVADLDAATGAITTTISTTLGTLSATAQNGAVVNGSGSNSVSISDIVADVNATLQTLSFNSASGGSGTITVATNDAGNTGGGALTDTDLIAINVDEAPQVTVSPATGATVAISTNVTVTFNEPVTLSGAWFALNCATSGNRISTGELTGTGIIIIENTPDLAYTIDPTVNFASGEACSVTITAANVADNDAIDPPNNPAADSIASFNVDAAPAVTTTNPSGGASNVAANATITVNFSENVNATAGAFALDCGAGPIALTPNTLANAGTITMTPGSALPPTSTCTVTVAAANVTDADAIDNPDNMATNHVFSFTTTDPAPTVVSTVPTNGGNHAANADIVVNFSEAVNFADASFTLACPGAMAFTSSGSGTSTATLNPTGNLPVGSTCTVTTLAAGISDVDAIDPPDPMVANHVFTFMPVNVPPTLTAGATLNYSEGDVPTAIDTTVTVADLDTPTLAGATAQISGGYVNGEDVLSFTNTPNITGTFAPATGTLTLGGVDTLANYQTALRSVTYANTSDTPSTAARTVTWIGNDGIANSLAVTSTINVAVTDDAPVAVADSATIVEDSAASAINVLGNDTDIDGGPISVTSVTQPANGVVVITGGGTGLTYQPDSNYCNTPPGSTLDTFTYTLTPGGSVATVSVNVSCTNDSPIANAGSATTNEDTPVTVTLVGSDPDGDALTFSIVTSPSQGSLGAITPLTPNSASVTYTPAVNYAGADSFTFQVNDGSDNSAPATVTISVTAFDDPPTAVADTATVVEDSGSGAVNVLANDTDVDAGPQSVSSVTQPANGTVVITGGGTGLTYAPDPNYCNSVSGTPDTFTYMLTPGGSSATVTMIVTCVNDAPVADADSFDFLGNTDLVVDLAALATPHALETTASTFGVIDGDSDPIEGDSLTVSAITVGGCTDNSAPLDCSDPAVGRVQMQSNGRFQFTPAPGDTGATETFQYTITDSGAPIPASATATVTLTRFNRIWYLNAGAPGGGNGTASSPLNSPSTLNGAGGAGDVDSTGDYIFVHNSASALAGGLELEANQHLLGEAAGLSIPVNLNGNGSPTNLVTAGPTRPQWNNSTGNAVSMSCAMPVEIRGLSLANTGGSANAIDLTCAAALTGSSALTINGNDFRGASAEGVDLNFNANSDGTLTLAFTNNTWIAAGTHTGNAFDLLNNGLATMRPRIDFSNNSNIVSAADAVRISDSGGLPGETTITGFANNNVSGDTVGTGIRVDIATFDADPVSAGYQQVSGGTTIVGASGNGTGQGGMILNSVHGDLAFTDLDLYSGTGDALAVTGSGAVNVGAGTGMRVAVTPNVGVLDAAAGKALFLGSLTADLQLTSLRSVNASTWGVHLQNVADGTSNAIVSAGATSSISNATNTDFVIDGGNATVSYAGTITDTSGQAVSVINTNGDTKTFSGAISHSGGAGVGMSSNTGSTINFTGGLTLNSGASPAFSATGGGTVNVTGAANTLASTTASALNVANTTIGASGLTFRSISANGAANGIVLNTTGAGGLTVTGTGGAGTGGTIQNSTGTGVLLNSTGPVSLSSMVVSGSGDDGINGASVNGLTLSGMSLTNNGNSTADEGLQLTQLSGAASFSNNTFTGSAHNHVYLQNTSTTVSSLAITNNTFNANNAATGNHAVLIEGVTGAPTFTSINISTNQFISAASIGLQVAASNNTSMPSLTISGNTFTNNVLAVDVSMIQASNVTFTAINNTVTTNHASGSHAFNSNQGIPSSGTVQGRIQNNTIGTAGVPNSGSPIGNGIRVIGNDNGTKRYIVTGSTIRETRNGRGIEVMNRNGTGAMDATVTNNNVNTDAQPANLPLSGILLQSNCVATCNTLRADVANNTVAVPSGGCAFDLTGTCLALVRSGATSTCQLVDRVPTGAATANAELVANNPASSSTSASAACTVIAGPIVVPP